MNSLTTERRYWKNKMLFYWHYKPWVSNIFPLNLFFWTTTQCNLESQLRVPHNVENMSGSQSSIPVKGGTYTAEPRSCTKPHRFPFLCPLYYQAGQKYLASFCILFFFPLSCQNHYKIGGKLSETEDTLNLPHLRDGHTTYMICRSEAFHHCLYNSKTPFGSFSPCSRDGYK